jgi:hypothetical protein
MEKFSQHCLYIGTVNFHSNGGKHKKKAQQMSLIGSQRGAYVLIIAM